ncbi:hypothetical protein [Acidianus sp. HS-5]|uniref:hypothetical protein n=1 Tax=Acidianus sp. HS-5 TaxID=2886040 RepID=UPI001F3B6DBA|nr:hypothetical protein [Acidianus sp. HS-5]
MEEVDFQKMVESPSSLGLQMKIRRAITWSEKERIKSQIHMLTVRGSGNKIKFMPGSEGEFLIYDGNFLYIYYPEEKSVIKFVI